MYKDKQLKPPSYQVITNKNDAKGTFKGIPLRLYEENVSKFIHTNFDGQKALKHAVGIKSNFKSSYKTKLSCSYQGEICSRTGKYNSPTLNKMYKKSVCLNIVTK